MPRKEKANPQKYEGKAFLTYEEAMDYLGVRRSSLYNYITEMNLDTHKFKRDRRRYLTSVDVKKIEQIMEEPWALEQKQDGTEEKSEAAGDAA